MSRLSTGFLPFLDLDLLNMLHFLPLGLCDGSSGVSGASGVEACVSGDGAGGC